MEITNSQYEELKHRIETMQTTMDEILCLLKPDDDNDPSYFGTFHTPDLVQALSRNCGLRGYIKRLL